MSSPTQRVPGDAAAIRAAAEKLRSATRPILDAERALVQSISVAAANWQGEARDAFMGAAASTGGRVAAVGSIMEAATILDNYANILENHQHVYGEAQQRSVAPLDAPPEVVQQTEGARLAMSNSFIEVMRANRFAAEEIARVSGRMKDELQGQQDFLKNIDVTSGAAAAWAEQQAGIVSTTAQKFVPSGASPLVAASDVGTTAKYGGAVTGAALAGFGQYLDDESNPYYSAGERAGRIATQTATVGGAAVAGGAIGAAVGSVVPIAGTALGGVIGFGVGAAVGYFSGEYVDSINDDLVDAGGRLGDRLGEKAKDINSW